jgi:hypothetical protein
MLASQAVSCAYQSRAASPGANPRGRFSAALDGRYRRIFLLTSRSREGPLTEPATAVRRRHDWQPEEGRLSSPRRLSECARQYPRLGRAASSGGLSVDIADVPLQRLVLPVDHHGTRRDACLPAPGRGRGDLRGDRAQGGDPSLRRAGRHEHAAQCRAGVEALATGRSR